ncbi:UDP-N-acetylmuramoylalanyl-D-glutamyl-2,6-diaminopimelate--D-alanyl-D-alanine ligase [invertebrate metagenome]|uniref:UDP-MurNAc-pentapeptide synthetase n=1 Tax=invertebrate metagenome TaxID=1711999 RepID=A0A484H677_9ZZZZ
MTSLWTATEAATATGGSVAADWHVNGVSIDSRTLRVGELFIALQGPNYDGHDFVATALARGATAAVVARIPDGVSLKQLLIVQNTHTALEALAHHARLRSSAQVVAITGSVGKTSTKEMLRRVLAGQGHTHASEGNLNNHLGVPLTLARMPAATAFVVLEMGMNHAGELAPLSRLAQPDVAVITAVEAVHLESFASTLAIADAKAEIFTGMNRNGIAILNRESPYFDHLARHALAAGITCIYGFGHHREAEFRLCNYALVENGTIVRANVLEQPAAYMLSTYGRHWALNSLAVLATVHAVGGRISQVANTLTTVHPLPGRGVRHKLILDCCGSSIEVIDESYNANPVAVQAAIEVLGAAHPGPGGRRIAVLGDMLELGTGAAALHADLAASILDHRIDLVFTAGLLMASLHEALPPERRGSHAVSTAVLAAQVVAAIRSGDVVLVKGSAGSQTGVILAALQRNSLTQPGTSGV